MKNFNPTYKQIKVMACRCFGFIVSDVLLGVRRINSEELMNF